MQAHHAFIFLISELLKALSRKGLMATRYLQQLILRKDTDVLYLRKNSLHHLQLYPWNNSLLTGLSSESGRKKHQKLFELVPSVLPCKEMN